jgi:LPS export ABC transporter protein LptC
MLRILRWTFISSALALLFFEVWVGFPTSLESSSFENPALNKPLQGAGINDKHMEGVHFAESQSGARDWELFAESAEGSQVSGEWILQKVKVLFYGDKGVEYTATGDVGQVDTKTKDIRITGHVLVVSQNGYQCATTKAHYTAKERLIQSDDKVRMTSPQKDDKKKTILDADTMKIEVDAKTINLVDNVHGEKRLDDGRLMTLSSDTARASNLDRDLILRGNVRTTLEAMSMESAETIVQYDPLKDFLKAVQVNGGVRLSDKDKFATAAAIRFDPLVDQFVLSGTPRVVQDGDELKGEQIIFSEGGRKVRVEKMKARLDQLSN